MRRRVAVSAIHLIRGGGFSAPWSHKLGILYPPFSLFSSNFHNDMPRIDFRVRELDDYSQDMVRMRPTAVDFAKLLNVVEMEHYSVALDLFDEMRQKGTPVNISINNCYCLLERVELCFATLGIFLKSGYESNVTTFGTLIKGLFIDDRVERTRWRPNVMASNALIGGLCKGGMVNDSFQLTSKVVDRGEYRVFNQRRHKHSLVGDSETTGASTYPKSFCEWLAGIIDGDGSIQVCKKGYTSLEITTGLEDLRLLRYIQNKLGGGIKMRAGAKSYRYRLHNHSGMVKLIKCVNGHIRHSARLLQLHRVCQVLEIPVILPVPLDAQSNWFAGFFDADGTISIAMKKGPPQLSIGVKNKLLQDVEPYKLVFGGGIFFDSGQNGYYQWSIHSREDVIKMLDYFKSNPFRSQKSQRFFLINEYYSLYDLKAFEPESIHHKVWLAFLDKWNNKLMI